MHSSVLTRRLFWTFEILLLAGTLGVAVWVSSSAEWGPLLLVGLLLVLAFAGEWFSVEVFDGALSASLVAIVLAMALLGPAPAAVCGIATVLHRSAARRLPATVRLNNLATFASVPLVGGLLVRAIAGDVHSPLNRHLTESAEFALIVFAVFILTLVLNFLLVGINFWLNDGSSLRRQTREFLPLLSGELAAGALAAILAVAYTNLGLSVLFGSVALLLIFQRLTAALVRSEHRAEQLEARSRQLVGLQLGVVRTLVRALKMRDPTTGQHASAVAHYCEALASAIGAPADQREAVRMAALLHDVGKFTWPDRVLHAEVVAEEDRAIVEGHAQEGAVIVGSLDGYGAAADAILYHHERVDGGGYPAGLIGQEIPLTSRILAICCTFDTMTGRGTYRSRMTAEEAMGELRTGAANGQFDSALVESFIATLTLAGPGKAIEEAHDADFEVELEFERRVKDMAEPQASGPTSRPDGPLQSWRAGVLSLRGRPVKK